MQLDRQAEVCSSGAFLPPRVSRMTLDNDDDDDDDFDDDDDDDDDNDDDDDDDGNDDDSNPRVETKEGMVCFDDHCNETKEKMSPN